MSNPYAPDERLQSGKRRLASISDDRAPAKRRLDPSDQAENIPHLEASVVSELSSPASSTLCGDSPQMDWQPDTSDLSHLAQRVSQFEQLDDHSSTHSDPGASRFHRPGPPRSQGWQAMRAQRTALGASTIIVGRPKEAVRVVSDTNSVCDTCATNESLPQKCSMLRAIQPEHHVLKKLVDEQCCSCVLRQKECETTLDAAEHSSRPAASSFLRPEDLTIDVRQEWRDKLSQMFTEAIKMDKCSVPPTTFDDQQYAQQCARNLELRVLASSISEEDYLIKMRSCRTNISKLRGQEVTKWLSEAFHDRSPINSLYATKMPSPPLLEESREELEHFESGHLHDRRQEHSFHELGLYSDVLAGGQLSAQDPSEHRFSAALSPVLSYEYLRNTTIGEENLPKHQELESADAIIKRSVITGIEIQKLEGRDRSDMMEWFDFVMSTHNLDKIKKALELAFTIQDLPLELRRAPRQACIGLLQTMMPENKWVTTVFSASEVSLKLQRDILELKLDMVRVRPRE